MPSQRQLCDIRQSFIVYSFEFERAENQIRRHNPPVGVHVGATETIVELFYAHKRDVG